MRAKGLRVVIIGAGTGGLCWAQGLRCDGIEVELFERDLAPTDRQQGYRLSINATGGARSRPVCRTDSLKSLSRIALSQAKASPFSTII
jgi:2-polyprenyl-6-methoxyphenol hydroxylase-like FAD-dependent oxidoreductase